MNTKIFENIFIGISALSVMSAVWVVVDPYSMVSYIPSVNFAVIFIILIYIAWLFKNNKFIIHDKDAAKERVRVRLNSPIAKLGQGLLVLSLILNFTDSSSGIINRFSERSFSMGLFMAVFSFAISGIFRREIRES